MTSTATALLHAWENGANRVPSERASSLLISLGRLPPGTSVDELTVGECDRLLLGLRRELFGDGLEVVATCPACHRNVEMLVSINELEQSLNAIEPRPPEIIVGGYYVRFRIPRNDDLGALHGAPVTAALDRLLSRCVLEVRDPAGEPARVEELPPDSAAAVSEAMAECDPGASLDLAVSCECGHAWLDELDIREGLWADVTDWLGSVLTEVHKLAHAYGWSESDILALPAWRRRWYLEALGL
jgi:hypothetical protein